MVVKNKLFQDWAEPSVHHEETKRWFEKIICCESEEDDVQFDNLCQKINWRLVHLLPEAWECGKLVFGRVVTMLREKDVGALLPVGKSLNERMGFVSLTLVLIEGIEGMQKTGVIALAENLRQWKVGDRPLGRKDVNKLHGWAIHCVRQVKQNQSFKMRKDGGDRTQLENTVWFLVSVVFHKSQALLKEEHCWNNHDLLLRSCDKGWIDFGEPKLLWLWRCFCAGLGVKGCVRAET